MFTRIFCNVQKATKCADFLQETKHMHTKYSDFMMPRNKKQNISEKKASAESQPSVAAVVANVKEKTVSIKVLAKPGSKQNGITEIGADGVSIQISAPPVDGEANAELIKYLSKVLGLRKSDLSLDKGSKSKHKTVVVYASVTAEEILKKLQSEMERS